MTIDAKTVFAAIVGELNVPVFLAEIDGSGARLTLHTRRHHRTAGLRQRTEALLRQAGAAVTVRVHEHSLRQMAFPRSLARWLAVFRHGTLIYDPTGIAGRVQALVRTADTVRTAFGDQIGGIYFDPARRELLVRYRHRFAALGPTAMTEIRTHVARAWAAEALEGAPVAVRPVEKLPNRMLIAVDNVTSGPFSQLARVLCGRLSTGAMALSLAALVMPAASRAHVADTADLATASMERPADRSFGILAGLSLFADEAAGNLERFSQTGLNHYFGAREEPVRLRLAQLWPWQEEDSTTKYGGY